MLYFDKNIRGSVSYAIADRSLSEIGYKSASAFAISHEAWHQMLEKALNYFVESQDKILKGTDFLARTKYAHHKLGIYTTEHPEPHHNGEPNLNMSKGKLSVYNQTSKGEKYYYYMGSTIPAEKEAQEQCLKILPIEFL